MENIKIEIKTLKAREDALKAQAAGIKKARADVKEALGKAREALKQAREAAKKAKAEAPKKPRAKAEKPKQDKAKQDAPRQSKPTSEQVANELASMSQRMFNRPYGNLGAKEINALRRAYAKANHPDTGGNVEKIKWANALLDQALKQARDYVNTKDYRYSRAA